MSNFFPKAKIHTWGGLGSQLYAAALAIDLQEIFKCRQIEYISHTSGVTRREPAILFYSRNVKEKDDYKIINSNHVNDNYRKKILFFAKKFLLITGIIANCNDNKETSNLKPWVLSIRGHYSGREVSFNSAKIILQKINNEFQTPDNNTNINAITLHYRLGDLELLSDKSSINADRMKNIIGQVLGKGTTKEIYLYSDSILLAKSKLTSGVHELNLIAREISPLKTIHECVHSKDFIGTNSKISIWVAILRATKSLDQISYLPMEIKHMLIGDENSFVHKSIKFY
jgi:hypothetical protein